MKGNSSYSRDENKGFRLFKQGDFTGAGGLCQENLVWVWRATEASCAGTVSGGRTGSKLTAVFKPDNIQAIRQETKENSMLQQIETPVFTLTPAAAQAVRDILEQRKLDGYALRVYVAGGGCCGVNFGMALDNNFRDTDTAFEADGVKVIVDEVSIDYLRDATVDFVNDPRLGQGFAVNSPHAKGHSHGEGGCACGGHEGGACGCGGGSCGCGNH
jgi:iron-sulfur cluster assembly protein